MFNSLIQALNLDSTFFIQLFVFLLIYPILSRLLIKPFYNLYKQGEQQTSDKVKIAEELKRKEQSLQTSYKEKAKRIYDEFNKLYEEQSYQLRKEFLRKREENQQKIDREYRSELEKLSSEFQIAQKELDLKTGELVKVTFNKLSS